METIRVLRIISIRNNYGCKLNNVDVMELSKPTQDKTDNHNDLITITGIGKMQKKNAYI